MMPDAGEISTDFCEPDQGVPFFAWGCFRCFVSGRVPKRRRAASQRKDRQPGAKLAVRAVRPACIAPDGLALQMEVRGREHVAVVRDDLHVGGAAVDVEEY